MKINKIPWQVELCNLPNDGENKTLGLCEAGEQIIKLQNGLNKEIARQTYIHELLHAIIFSYGLHLEDEESVCDFVAAHFSLIEKLVKRFDNGTLY